jgi:hypothetical protein
MLGLTSRRSNQLARSHPPDRSHPRLDLILMARSHPHARSHPLIFFIFLGFRRASSTAFPWGYSSTNFGGASYGMFITLDDPLLGVRGRGIEPSRFVRWTMPHESYKD